MVMMMMIVMSDDDDGGHDDGDFAGAVGHEEVMAMTTGSWRQWALQRCCGRFG